MKLRCFLGFHKMVYKKISIWGSLDWGMWQVSRECSLCGETTHYHISNRKEADRIEKVIEEEIIQ